MPAAVVIWNLLRHVPKDIVLLIVAIVKDVAQQDGRQNQYDVAWKARIASHQAAMELRLRSAGKL